MPKKPIEQKIREDYPEFFEVCQTLKSEDIDTRLAQLAKDMESVAEAQDGDDQLREAKEKYSAYASPYREAKNALRLKTRYLIKLQKERGGA